MTAVSKALIIADPWIGYILDGSKTWEMRSSRTAHRGWFGLIRKGSGAVWGVARLMGVGDPLAPAEMIASFEKHRIPNAMIRSGEVAKWSTPWKLADVRRLPRPVPYIHKSGAVTWVELDAAAIIGVAGQLGDYLPVVREAQAPPKRRANDGEILRVDVSQRGRKLLIDIEWDDGKPASQARATRLPAQPAPPTRPTPVSPTPTGPTTGIIGEVAITDGNIANNHVYLRSFFDRFPADAIGGSSKATAARRTITVDWGGPEPVITDLDGAKKFFRARSWIGAFYRLNRAEAGDVVVVEQTAPYRYRIRLQKAASRRRAV